MKSTIEYFKYHVLSYSVFDSEPLHNIITSYIKKHSLTKSDIIETIKNLFDEGFIEINFQNGISGEPYRLINILNIDELEKYAEENLANISTDILENGDYYIKTTESGILQLKDEDKPL